ncbi:MAG: RNA 2',3'-cyclic phosphodiesterase [Hyphomicrobiales bacterium]
MPRLFSGIEIPRPIGDRLAMLKAPLPGARWVDPDNYHVTLRFIGDVDDIAAREFAANLDRVRAAPFDLTLDGLGSFGRGKPHSIWARVAPCAALDALQRAHERAARSAELPPESRQFHAHVTVARLRNTRPEAVARYLEQRGAFYSGPFRVSRFVLFSSRASTGGGPYVVEEDYPFELAGSPA